MVGVCQRILLVVYHIQDLAVQKKGNTGISTLGCFPHEADLDNMDYFQFEEHVLGNTTKKESGASCAHGQKLSLCPCNVGEAKHEHLLSAAR